MKVPRLFGIALVGTTLATVPLAAQVPDSSPLFMAPDYVAMALTRSPEKLATATASRVHRASSPRLIQGKAHPLPPAPAPDIF